VAYTPRNLLASSALHVRAASTKQTAREQTARYGVSIENA